MLLFAETDEWIPVAMAFVTTLGAVAAGFFAWKSGQDKLRHDNAAAVLASRLEDVERRADKCEKRADECEERAMRCQYEHEEASRRLQEKEERVSALEGSLAKAQREIAALQQATHELSVHRSPTVQEVEEIIRQRTELNLKMAKLDK
jgi:chromosome segregation ATPase